MNSAGCQLRNEALHLTGVNSVNLNNAALNISHDLACPHFPNVGAGAKY